MLQARCLAAAREHYTPVSRGANLQGGKDGALNGREIIRPQAGGNVPAVQENSVQPAERYTGEHVTFGPYVLPSPGTSRCVRSTSRGRAGRAESGLCPSRPRTMRARP